MADDFELRLQRVLRTDAERAVRPFDAVAFAESAKAAGPVARRPLAWRPAGWPMIRFVLIASALVLAALATLWLVAGGLPKRPSLVDAVPSLSPDASPLAAQLAGHWIATAPGDLTIADGSVADPFVLTVEGGGGQAYLQPPRGQREKLASSLSTTGSDVLRFVKRPSPPEDVTLGGDALGACASGDEGTYRATRTPDGLRLTLEVLADACPSRAAVLGRTWFRYLGSSSAGGIGVIDAFDPPFTMTLPPGSYEATTFPGGVSVAQAAPEFEFFAFKNPQGFNDPCNPIDGGRRSITDSADFVDYFGKLPGFTVDGVIATEIDGRPATNLKVRANDDASCPAGWLAEWQPEELTGGDQLWVLRPGDWDSLYLVDLADTTLMFQVLGGANPDLESQIIPSIRLLEDGLPTSP